MEQRRESGNARQEAIICYTVAVRENDGANFFSSSGSHQWKLDRSQGLSQADHALEFYLPLGGTCFQFHFWSTKLQTGHAQRRERPPRPIKGLTSCTHILFYLPLPLPSLHSGNTNQHPAHSPCPKLRSDLPAPINRFVSSPKVRLFFFTFSPISSNPAMAKVKPELMSSPNSPGRACGGKRSSTNRRRYDRRSQNSNVPTANLPSDEADSSRPSTFRRTRSQGSQNKPEIERARSDSDTDNDDSAEEAEILDPPANTHPRRSNAHSSLHKGNTEPYVRTLAQFSPAVRVPRTTSSKRKDGTDKRTLHRFTNEEHRFIWFYRNDLGCSRGDTYVHFNEYFGLQIRKDSIANTYERLKQRRPSEICSARHTEPWAVGQSDDAQTKVPVVILDEESAPERSDEELDSRSAMGGYTPSTAGIEQAAPSLGLDLTKPDNESPPQAKSTRGTPESAVCSTTGSDAFLNTSAQGAESRKRKAGIRSSDSSQPKQKRRPYHRRNADSSPTPRADTRRHFSKRRVRIGSADHGARVVKGGVRSLDEH
ncbi:unnamed protein product [Tuber aestivum]|uniref:Uncharacterized protein n=1 Tax=Tuber aestivum TaxID=59557 RepID=A0A292PX62_9PEZI|nr:unnamed protein product [Tuber aestivum]